MDISSYLSIAQKVIADSTLVSNATLIYQMTSDVNISIDSDGNATVANTEQTITISCWLYQATPPPNLVQDGLGVNRGYFRGKLISPKTFTLPYRPENGIEATVNGRRGFFYPVEIYDTPAALQWQINTAFGQRIAGWFEVQEGD